MKIIAHRRNTLDQLATTPESLGVEVDIRSQGESLVIHHDPFEQGLGFETWLESFRHGTLILNVKEEGLEERLLSLMHARGIEDFFFLDQSFPFLMRTVRSGETRCAVRVSEYEAIETAMSLSRQAEWVWVDCFTRFPLDAVSATRLSEAGFKLCIVSPELQGHPESWIGDFRELMEREGIRAEAVCTKRPEMWQ